LVWLGLVSVFTLAKTEDRTQNGTYNAPHGKYNKQSEKQDQNNNKR